MRKYNYIIVIGICISILLGGCEEPSPSDIGEDEIVYEELEVVEPVERRCYEYNSNINKTIQVGVDWFSAFELKRLEIWSDDGITKRSDFQIHRIYRTWECDKACVDFECVTYKSICKEDLPDTSIYIDTYGWDNYDDDLIIENQEKFPVNLDITYLEYYREC